jgi:ankyrin repeat protein
VSIVKLLVDVGANVAIPDREGVTALSHAKARGYEEIVAPARCPLVRGMAAASVTAS